MIQRKGNVIMISHKLNRQNCFKLGHFFNSLVPITEEVDEENTLSECACLCVLKIYPK